MMEDNKIFVSLSGVHTDIGCKNNEITVYYHVMTKDEALQKAATHSYLQYGTDKIEPKTNKIKLENPDPKLLYTIFELLGRMGYAVIEIKEKDDFGFDK